jgi:vitamin B12 transporter
MNARALLATVLVALACSAGAAKAARVTGVVIDRAGKPIELATVAVPAAKVGGVTDEKGIFTLELPPGPTVIQISLMGYEPAHANIVVADGHAPLRITLNDEPVALAEVTVTTSSFGKSGRAEGPVLRRMDVYMTPGAAADVFQALRALPGANAPVEGAAVYVRGGAPDETLIRLDGGSIGHPYHFEGASGGLFSTLDPYMLKSAFFSSGGFSARYGGVLSGVLDIETQDPMNLKTVSFGANMAGAGLSASWALVPDKLSFIGAIRRGYPELLFKLYGSRTTYESAPTSGSAVGKLLYRYSPTGRLALAWLDSGDDVTLRSNYLNYEGPYSQSTRSKFGALIFSEVLAGKMALRGQASGQYYDSRTSFGPLASARTERNGQANLDAVWPVNSRLEVSFGGNEQHRGTEVLGRFPADSTDFGPGAPTRQFDTRPTAETPGFYLENKLRLWGPLYATFGGRLDYTSVPGVWTTDPRAALAWRIGEHQTVRVASGRYHQLADVQFLDPRYGNPNLRPLEADHVIAGYEWKSEYGNVRVEGYRKDYHHLVTNAAETFYANGGTGYARGVDVFLQGTHKWLSGWMSYGYLDSKRKENDDRVESPSTWGVRHTLSLVGSYQVASVWLLGARYGYGSGRPYTPVVGRTYDASRQLWRPIFGDHGSARLPEYHRLDLRTSRLFTLPKGAGLPASSVCVLYVEAMNVLGIRNVLEYIYNSDYSQRYPRDSYFARRLAVAGVALTW